MAPDSDPNGLRDCLREPIPEIAVAAQYLDAAVSAHLSGDQKGAGELIRLADMPVIREWTESVWGKDSPYLYLRGVDGMKPNPPKTERDKMRMPSAEEKASLHRRDGYICRFCSIPVIRSEVRKRVMAVYPLALPWGRKNSEQHAAFQAMWAQYDHLTPHALGGVSDLDNMVVTCAPCNFGRMSHTLAALGLRDPRKGIGVKSCNI